MANMNVAIRLGRKPRNCGIMLPAGQIIGNDLPDKIKRLRLGVFVAFFQNIVLIPHLFLGGPKHSQTTSLNQLSYLAKRINPSDSRLHRFDFLLLTVAGLNIPSSYE